jgi:hypothetical protein
MISVRRIGDSSNWTSGCQLFVLDLSWDGLNASCGRLGNLQQIGFINAISQDRADLPREDPL